MAHVRARLKPGIRSPGSFSLPGSSSLPGSGSLPRSVGLLVPGGHAPAAGPGAAALVNGRVRSGDLTGFSHVGRPNLGKLNRQVLVGQIVVLSLAARRRRRLRRGGPPGSDLARWPAFRPRPGGGPVG
jgi:hypothetical protein